jgi:hypothetical protein
MAKWLYDHGGRTGAPIWIDGNRTEPKVPRSTNSPLPRDHGRGSLLNQLQSVDRVERASARNVPVASMDEKI